MLAAHAADRVRGVLGSLRASTFQAQAVVQAAGRGARGEAGHQRVVTVEDRAGLRRQCLDRGLQPAGHRVQLAKAVQLVAEDVGDQDHVRSYLRRHLPHRRLVDLEQKQLGVDPASQAGFPHGDRGHPLEQVGPGPVLGHADAGGLRESREHPAGRRLAVAAQDHRRARPARRGDLPQHERIYAPCDRTRKTRPAADVQQPGRGPGPLAHRQRERAAHPPGGQRRMAPAPGSGRCGYRLAAVSARYRTHARPCALLSPAGGPLRRRSLPGGAGAWCRVLAED